MKAATARRISKWVSGAFALLTIALVAYCFAQAVVTQYNLW